MTEKRKYKHGSELRKFWREQKRKYRARKKAQAKQNKPKPTTNETKLTHTYLPTYVPKETITNETGGEGRASL